MRGPTQQRPQETDVATRQWGDHVDGCVLEAEGEDFGLGWHAQQRVAQG